MPNYVLQGLRVLDLSQLVAGPYCSRILAGLGADVVKVEPPEGDSARHIGSRLGGTVEGSTLFLFLNQGKKSIVLDITRTDGRAELEKLVRLADVLIESCKPRESVGLRLRFDDLKRLNPALVVTSISPFGRSGPYRDYAGDETIACALGGLHYLTGNADREPLRPPGWQASYLAGAVAAYGTLLALRHRNQSGRGQQVDVSLIESVASVLEGALPAAALGQMRSRRGNKRTDGNPTLLMPCRDGHVVVSVSGDSNWADFGRFIGDTHLTEPEYRLQHLESVLQNRLASFSRAQFFHGAQEWRFPCCSVLRPEELADDPQHRSRRFFAVLDHPVVGRLHYPGAPFRLGRGSWRGRRAPLFGEHSLHATIGRWLRISTLKRSADALPVDTGKAPAGPLAGIRVLDLTSMWAGPFCTRLLADAGAEVIKIEMPGRPDGIRSANVMTTRSYSPFFAELNRNKLGISLDLRRGDHRERFFDLLKTSDVVVESFSPRVMPNLRLDYTRLRGVKPDIVMLSMPAFGGTGPYRNAVAFGSGIEAMAGLTAITGYGDDAPGLLGIPYGDPVAGLHGAIAVLTALEHRRRTGEGQHIDLAQREALSQFIGEVVVAAAGRPGKVSRAGNRHSDMAPHGCYKCLGEDRWLAIAVASDGQWVSLCQAIGKAELATDPRLATLAKRLKHQDQVDACISEWTSHREAGEAMSILQNAGVPSGVIQSPADLLQDKQLNALGFLKHVTARSIEVYPGAICHLSASPLRVRFPAPSLEGDIQASDPEKWRRRQAESS